MLPLKYLPAFIAILLFNVSAAFAQTDNGIRPYEANPAYWQYKGEPVLLLGGTRDDNLFQHVELESHLDTLKKAGGNYIRNTMSDRDPGDARAFVRNVDGKYDLRQWNDDYWNRFENLLKLTSERDIIVQIEIWDRFDHSRAQWETDPYNPKNNINYTFEESGLELVYPSHPGKNKQPFFYTVPALQHNTTILQYQQAFVRKLLSVSLRYHNVMYCIDNETSGAEEWAIYWADFIKENTNGKKVFITQMWNGWDVKAEIHKRTIDHPERYDYIDLSQNSHVTGFENWQNQQYVFDCIKSNPRPVNSTKIYGSDNGKWLDRGITAEHAIQTFFRNILGGFASSRFHRPQAGLALTDPSIHAIKTVRKIEDHVKMWDVSPRMDLLSDVEENEAYLAATEGESYVVYFTKGGSVKLDLAKHPGKFRLKWISVKDSKWSKGQTLRGGKQVMLAAPHDEGCLAVICSRS